MYMRRGADCAPAAPSLTPVRALRLWSCGAGDSLFLTLCRAWTESDPLPVVTVDWFLFTIYYRSAVDSDSTVGYFRVRFVPCGLPLLYLPSLPAVVVPAVICFGYTSLRVVVRYALRVPNAGAGLPAVCTYAITPTVPARLRCLPAHCHLPLGSQYGFSPFLCYHTLYIIAAVDVWRSLVYGFCGWYCWWLRCYRRWVDLPLVACCRLVPCGMFSCPLRLLFTVLHIYGLLGCLLLVAGTACTRLVVILRAICYYHVTLLQVIAATRSAGIVPRLVLPGSGSPAVLPFPTDVLPRPFATFVPRIPAMPLPHYLCHPATGGRPEGY